jgi:ABC-type amino acid transport substrate-binding protein
MVVLPVACTLSSPFVSADTYIVGAQNIEYYPYYNFSSDYEKGLGWAILEAFSKQSGHRFVYLSMPVKRLQIELKKGNVDFVFPDNSRWYDQITHGLKKVYSKPLTETFAVTLVKSENVGKGMNHISRIATPDGFSPVKWEQQIRQGNVDVTGVEGIYDGLRLLQDKKVDALDVEYNAAQYFVRRFPQMGPFTADLTLPHNVVTFSLSTLKYPDIVDELNAFLVSESDDINKIKAKYGIEDTKKLIDRLMKEQGISENTRWKPL